MVFKIGLLGLGTVGTGTVEILSDPRDRHPLLQELQIWRVGVRNLAKSRRVCLDPGLLTTDLGQIVTDPEVDVVVEVLGGLEPARTLILQAIQGGKHVVTANKAVIARHGSEIFSAAARAGVYVFLEAAVAGGIPVIEPLKQSLGANRIKTITGILNGTTNYILSQMSEGRGDFAAVLAAAQAMGYAEADPATDIDGLDAADKIAILASLGFGGQVDREEVYCEGIRHIQTADIAYAQRLGFRIKLLATAQRQGEQIQVRVHPTLVPQAHPLASVNDVYNAVLVDADPVGEVMFLGRGAGAGPTASAVVADLLNLTALVQVGAGLDPLRSWRFANPCSVAPMADLVGRFYVRILSQDSPGVIGSLGTCFGSHGVSLESVVQTGFLGSLAEIVLVTHNVREKHFQAALTALRHLEPVHQVATMVRVLAESPT